jgi:hypothetical protein
MITRIQIKNRALFWLLIDVFGVKKSGLRNHPVNVRKLRIWMAVCGIFIFLNGQENETKESARVTGCVHALLTIRGVCGTRCAQTATDPTSADGCDARPVTKG